MDPKTPDVSLGRGLSSGFFIRVGSVSSDIFPWKRVQPHRALGCYDSLCLELYALTSPVLPDETFDAHGHVLLKLAVIRIGKVGMKKYGWIFVSKAHAVQRHAVTTRQVPFRNAP